MSGDLTVEMQVPIIESEPLSVWSTRMLEGEMATASQERLDAILAELATRTGWPPYSGLCLP